MKPRRWRSWTPELQAGALEHRKNPTPAEAALFEALRGGAIDGLRFRRQQPFERFILDFYCAPLRLCIELDGGVHDTGDQRERDALRTECLQARGITVIRFRNEEVLSDVAAVVRRIRNTINEIRYGPPPDELLDDH